MKLKKLNFEEQPLTREELLQIKGGLAASYTVSKGTNCKDTGNPQTADCSDGGEKD